MAFRIICSVTLSCFAWASIGGNAYAGPLLAEKQKKNRSLKEVAASMGVDLEQLVDPVAYEKKRGPAIEKRRKEAVAQLQRNLGGDPDKRARHERAVEEVQKQHESSRLAGISQMLGELEKQLPSLRETGSDATARKETAARLRSYAMNLAAAKKELGRVDRAYGDRLKQRFGLIEKALESNARAAEKGLALPVGELEKALAGRSNARPSLPAPAKRAPPERLEPRQVLPKEWRAGVLSPAARSFFAQADGAMVPTPAGLLSAEQLATEPFPSEKIPRVLYASNGGGFYEATELLIDAALAALPPPTAADLVETPEVRLTPELQALAARLGKNPIALYNHVHDEYDSEVYYGSRKGSEGARLTKAGNDFDLSSLLVALLRASGIPARYEYGSVRLSPEQAMDWAGTLTPQDAADYFATAGYPVRAQVNAKNEVEWVDLEHVWVRAYVRYGNYRGLSPADGEQLWVRLDPTLKQYEIEAGIDLRGAVPFDFAGILAAPSGKMPLELFEESLRQYVRTHDLECKTLEQATIRRTLVPDRMELLPGDLPARVLNTLSVFDKVPATMRLRVTYSGAVSATLDVPTLFGKELALKYRGAYSGDNQAIATAGGIRFVNPRSVFVVPTLRVDGVEVAVGETVQPGTYEDLEVSLSGARIGYAPETHLLTAGEASALYIDAGGVPDSIIAAREGKLAQAVSARAPLEEVEEAKAQVAVARYFKQANEEGRRLYALQRYAYLHDVNFGLAAREFKSTEMFGQVVSVRAGHWLIDVPRGSGTAVGPQDSVRLPLMRLYGYQTSAGEHRIWEQVVHGTAVSAVKTLQLATQQGIEVLTIDKSNASKLGALTGYTSGARSDMSRIVYAGMTLQVPAKPITFGPFQGIEGYIGVDLATSNGVYRLYGTANGGSGADGSSNGSGGGGCGCGMSCAPVASMVDFAFGSYEFQEKELMLPGVGIPIVFSRAYRSKTLKPYRSSLGEQWQISYEENLTFEAGGEVLFVNERLGERRFVPDGAGGYTRPRACESSLIGTASGYRMMEKDGAFREFDAQGRLVAIEDHNGNRVQVLRDAAGKLTSVKDASGRTALTFAYGTNGLLESVTDHASRRVSFQYQGTDLKAVTDVMGYVEQYEYDSQHRMVSKTDKRGFKTTLRYDGEGRWAGITDPLGNEASVAYDFKNHKAVYTDKRGSPTLWEYNEAGNPTAITDPVGNRTEMEWDASGKKTAEVDARGNRTSIEYDSAGNLKEKTDALGNKTSYTYDAKGNVLTETDAAGNTTTHQYDARGNRTSTTDALNNVTTFAYTAKGQLETATQGDVIQKLGYDAAGNIGSMQIVGRPATVFEYDAAGHFESSTDGAGKKTSYEVDARGKQISATDPFGRKTTNEYDAEGHLAATIDPAGGRTELSYDAMGRLVSSKDALGNVTRTEYDPEGNVLARIDARGNRTSYRYDAAGRLEETTSADGATTSTIYCADAAPCSTVDALGNVTLMELDALGRPIRAMNGSGNIAQKVYDSMGRVWKEIDAEGNETTYGFDKAGRLETMTDGVGAITRFEYNSHGNKTAVIDANGGVTRYQYEAGKLTSEWNPLNIETKYTYNARGQRETKLDGNGKTTRYEYDDAGRQTATRFQDGTSYEYDYNERGSRTLERGPSHERTLTFDSSNRVKRVDDITLGKAIEYGYDASGNLEWMMVDGLKTTCRYDTSNRLLAVIDPTGETTRLAYDKAGNRTELVFGNGVKASYTYDSSLRLTGIVYKSARGEVLQSFQYRLNANGDRLEKAFADGTREEYEYDASRRLTRAYYSAQDRDVRYALDDLGNWTEVAERLGATSTVTTYVNNLFNQLTESWQVEAQKTHFAYDNNGSLIEESKPNGDVPQYVYDEDNRLRRAVMPGGIVNDFEYDANGIRTQKVESQATTKYLLDHASVVAEYDEAGARKTFYVNNPQRIDEVFSAEVSGGTVARKLYPLTDALGSVYALVDRSGAVVRTNSYEVFGKRTETGAGPSLAMGHTGREQDPDTGLDYHRDRYKSPLYGRWTQPDRLGMVDGPNLYQYVDGIPVLLGDPAGFSAQERAQIIATFGSIVDSWTQAGRRLPLPRLNNVLYSFGVFGVLNNLSGCAGQSHDLLDELIRRVEIRDYSFSHSGRGRAQGGILPHQWAIAASRKDDSVLVLDAWEGTIYETRYYSDWNVEASYPETPRSRRPASAWVDVTMEADCIYCFGGIW